MEIDYGKAGKVSEIEEVVEEEGEIRSCTVNYNYSSDQINDHHGLRTSTMASIKEEEEEEEEKSSLFSLEFNESSVYVAVGESQSSMDALCWTLTHFLKPSSSSSSPIIYLIHVFPEIRHIPSPLGMLPKSQVSPARVENYMAQERGRRRQLLQKFLDICSASKVKVDTILIESDMVAKPILDLIPILNITKLVVGSSKLSSKRGTINSKIAHQIFESAPNSCQVKVICQGKEIISQNQMIGSPSPSTSAPPLNPDASPSTSLPPLNPDDNFSFNTVQPAHRRGDKDHDDSFACLCFAPKF